MDYSAYHFEALPQRKNNRFSHIHIPGESDSQNNQLQINTDQNNIEKTVMDFDEESYPLVPIPENIEYSEQRPISYEYLDNTADIQIHSWGSTLEESLEQAVISMFGYMTPIDGINIDLKQSPRRIRTQGRDLLSLVFHFLDESLGLFFTEYFLIRDIHITHLDLETFSIEAIAFGEFWNSSKHKQGTEVKAVTYSNMQVQEIDGQHHIYAILDI